MNTRHHRIAAPLTLATALVAAAELRAQDAPSSAAPARAQAPTTPARRRPLDLSIAVRGGTLGYGAEVGKLVTSHLGVRVAAYRLAYARAQAFDDVQYDAQLKLQSASALVDLFPGRRGRFHLTGGVVAGTNEVTGTGVPEGDTFFLNGQPYSSAEVGTLTGAVRFPPARPYAGLGWGTPAKNSGGIGFSTDLGVVMGRPTAVLTATGMAADPELSSDLEAQRADAQEQLDQYARFYPVLNLGLTYRF